MRILEILLEYDRSKELARLNKFKIDQLETKFNQPIDQIAEFLENIDPTITKKYTSWLIRMALTYELTSKLTDILATFDQLKIKKIINTDINQLKSPDQLISIVQDNIDQLPKFKLVYEDKDFKIQQILNASAAQLAATSTSWCTKDPEVFQRYVSDPASKLYFIETNNRQLNWRRMQALTVNKFLSELKDRWDTDVHPIELIYEYPNIQTIFQKMDLNVEINGELRYADNQIKIYKVNEVSDEDSGIIISPVIEAKQKTTKYWIDDTGIHNLTHDDQIYDSGELVEQWPQLKKVLKLKPLKIVYEDQQLKLAPIRTNNQKIKNWLVITDQSRFKIEMDQYNQIKKITDENNKPIDVNKVVEQWPQLSTINQLKPQQQSIPMKKLYDSEHIKVFAPTVNQLPSIWRQLKDKIANSKLLMFDINGVMILIMVDNNQIKHAWDMNNETVFAIDVINAINQDDRLNVIKIILGEAFDQLNYQAEILAGKHRDWITWILTQAVFGEDITNNNFATVLAAYDQLLNIIDSNHYAQHIDSFDDFSNLRVFVRLNSDQLQ